MRGLLQNVTGRDAIPKARVLWTAVNLLPERIRNVYRTYTEHNGGAQEDERGFGDISCSGTYMNCFFFRDLWEACFGTYRNV